MLGGKKIVNYRLLCAALLALSSFQSLGADIAREVVAPNDDVEYVEDSFSNLTVGYQLTGPEHGNIELIATNLFDDIERNHVPGLESIADRDADINLGVRSSFMYGNTIIASRWLDSQGRCSAGSVRPPLSTVTI